MIPSERKVNRVLTELEGGLDVPTRTIAEALAIIIRLLVAIYSKPDAND